MQMKLRYYCGQVLVPLFLFGSVNLANGQIVVKNRGQVQVIDGGFLKGACLPEKNQQDELDRPFHRKGYETNTDISLREAMSQIPNVSFESSFPSEVNQNNKRGYIESQVRKIKSLEINGTKYEVCLSRETLKLLERVEIPPSENLNQASSASSGSQIRAVGSGEEAQASINQSIALAQQNQAKAEEKRKKDGRRRNRPDLVASDCLTPDTGPRDHGFSVFKNSCSEPVDYTYCTVGAQEGSLAAFVSCTNRHGNRGGGAGSVRAGGESAAPMRGASEVHWLACKRPARAITRGFENGKLVGDCIDLGV